MPLYLLPAANLVIYLALNGYLLGREYFELVAHQRLALGEARQQRRGQRGRLWLAGAAIAVMLMIPVFNLVAPVVAIAFMVHLVTPRLWRGAGGRGQHSALVAEHSGNSLIRRQNHLTSLKDIVTNQRQDLAPVSG